MDLVVVVGARPNFIKVGPLMPALASAGIDAAIAHTGQHYDAAMSDVFFADLELPEPRWYLDVGSGTHAVQTGVAMMRLEELLEAEKPSAVLVVGDVNSTLAGALAAVKVGVPVVHLEAGLRSGDMSMPEEVNRLVTDQLSALLLAPTRDALRHLSAEGVEASRVHFVGNIMAESLLRNLPKLQGRDVCGRYGVGPGEYMLATVHRPENTDAPGALEEIAAALIEQQLEVVFPVHPRTVGKLKKAGLGDAPDHVRLIDPAGYLEMLALERDAAVILTDSGGVQEEACLLRTPCVTVRRNTERVVTVEAGANRLVAAEKDAISGGIAEALASSNDWEIPERWDDRVAERVVEAIGAGVAPLQGCA